MAKKNENVGSEESAAKSAPEPNTGSTNSVEAIFYELKNQNPWQHRETSEQVEVVDARLDGGHVRVFFRYQSGQSESLLQEGFVQIFQPVPKEAKAEAAPDAYPAVAEESDEEEVEIYDNFTLIRSFVCMSYEKRTAFLSILSSVHGLSKPEVKF